MDTPYTYAGVEAGWRSIAAAGPGKRAIDHAGIDDARAAILPAFEAHANADGTVHLDNVFRYVIGRR